MQLHLDYCMQATGVGQNMDDIVFLHVDLGGREGVDAVEPGQSVVFLESYNLNLSFHRFLRFHWSAK